VEIVESALPRVANCCVALGRGVQIALVCCDVCVNDRHIKHMSGATKIDRSGDLRTGRDALAHVWESSR
jgi:hypothetical protein